MKVLLTGVTGFVGTHLANFLIKKGYSVYGLIRKPIIDQGISSRLTNVKLYLFDDKNLISVISEIKPDLVIHLASLYLTSHQYEQIGELINSNVSFPAKLLEAMSVNNITKFINTGTSWQHYNSSSYEPVNLYAATKQAFDDIVKYYTSAKGFACITLKLFDTYGPNDTRGKLISLLDKLSCSNDSLSMSQGEQVVELTHISDVCSAYQVAIDMISKLQAGDNYSYGVDSNSRLRLKDLVTEYERVNCVKLNIKWGERPYRDREVMQPCNNLNNIPGWEPSISLSYGLNKANR